MTLKATWHTKECIEHCYGKVCLCPACLFDKSVEDTINSKYRERERRS